MTHLTQDRHALARRLREDAFSLALGARSDLLGVAQTEVILGREIDRPTQQRLRRMILGHIADVKRTCAKLMAE